MTGRQQRDVFHHHQEHESSRSESSSRAGTRRASADVHKPHKSPAPEKAGAHKPLEVWLHLRLSNKNLLVCGTDDVTCHSCSCKLMSAYNTGQFTDRLLHERQLAGSYQEEIRTLQQALANQLPKQDTLRTQLEKTEVLENTIDILIQDGKVTRGQRDSVIRQLTAELKEERAHNVELENALQSPHLRTMMEEIQSLQDRFDKLNSENITLQTDLSKSRKEIVKLNNCIEAMRNGAQESSRRKDAGGSYTEMKSEIQHLQNSVMEHKARYDNVLNDNMELRNKLQSYNEHSYETTAENELRIQTLAMELQSAKNLLQITTEQLNQTLQKLREKEVCMGKLEADIQKEKRSAQEAELRYKSLMDEYSLLRVRSRNQTPLSTPAGTPPISHNSSPPKHMKSLCDNDFPRNLNFLENTPHGSPTSNAPQSPDGESEMRMPPFESKAIHCQPDEFDVDEYGSSHQKEIRSIQRRVELDFDVVATPFPSKPILVESSKSTKSPFGKPPLNPVHRPVSPNSPIVSPVSADSGEDDDFIQQARKSPKPEPPTALEESYISDIRDVFNSVQERLPVDAEGNAIQHTVLNRNEVKALLEGAKLMCNQIVKNSLPIEDWRRDMAFNQLVILEAQLEKYSFSSTSNPTAEELKGKWIDRHHLQFIWKTFVGLFELSQGDGQSNFR